MTQPPRTEPRRTAADKTGRLSGFFGFFWSKAFGRAIAIIFGMAVVGFFLLNSGLKWYTNHGQRLEVGDYIDLPLAEAKTEIERADFRVQIIDSVFLVDRPPHIVLRQDPPPGAFVKENRRIYLTVTKAVADEVELPSLAGTYDFDRYLRKLRLLDIEGEVRERVYSNRYQANTILKVFYEGREISESQLKQGFSIPKGSKLQFTVSSKEGGLADVPNVTCLTLEEARFFIRDYRLRVGRVETDATVSNPELAYVWRQDPPYSLSAKLPFESEVHLFVTSERPASCDE